MPLLLGFEPQGVRAGLSFFVIFEVILQSFQFLILERYFALVLLYHSFHGCHRFLKSTSLILRFIMLVSEHGFFSIDKSKHFSLRGELCVFD